MEDTTKNLVTSVTLGYTEKQTIFEPSQKMVLELVTLVTVYDEEGHVSSNLVESTAPKGTDIPLPRVKALYLNMADIRASRLFIAHTEDTDGDSLQVVLDTTVAHILPLSEGADFTITSVIDSENNNTFRVLIESNSRLSILTYTYGMNTRSVDSLYEYSLKGIRVEDDGRLTSVYYGEGTSEDALLFCYITGTETKLIELNLS